MATIMEAFTQKHRKTSKLYSMNGISKYLSKKGDVNGPTIDA